MGETRGRSDNSQPIDQMVRERGILLSGLDAFLHLKTPLSFSSNNHPPFTPCSPAAIALSSHNSQPIKQPQTNPTTIQ
jgi:hypothetical protein